MEMSGNAVCMHTSLRSFGPIEGGADTIIDAYLTEGCTLMVPTFAHGIFGIDLPPDFRPARNGVDYDDPSGSRPSHDRTYSPSTNEIDGSMGTLPRVVLERPDRIRGAHPLSSFAAIGPLAHRLIDRQRPLDIYAPLAALAKLDGFVILAGVGLERMTLIHLAEKRAGRTLFRRAANGPDGEVIIVETGSCSEGFVHLEPMLRPIRREQLVGESLWQIFPAMAALNITTHAIRRNPRITHCGQDCIRCDHQVAGGPIF